MSEIPGVRVSTHQRGLTQQFASSDQVANCDVEVSVPTAPVGDLGEGVSGQDVLQGEKTNDPHDFWLNEVTECSL